MTSHSPNLICIGRITSFLLFIWTLFTFLLITLLKIVDFKNKSVQFAMQMGILLPFQNTQEGIKCSKGGLHWLNVSQNFRIAITMLPSPLIVSMFNVSKQRRLGRVCAYMYDLSR